MIWVWIASGFGTFLTAERYWEPWIHLQFGNDADPHKLYADPDPTLQFDSDKNPPF
jgi:hypothetical protein